MKRSILFFTFVFSALILIAQNGSLMEIKKGNYGTFWVSPVDNGTLKTNKIINGHAIVKDQEYLNSLFNEVIENILPPSKTENLHKRSFVFLLFDGTGKVLYCNFSVDTADMKILTGKELRAIYTKFMATKIDTGKVSISQVYHTSHPEMFDAVLTGPLMPPKYFKKIKSKN